MTWTPERVESLKRLWAEGHSASQIGLALDVTRNTIIGKVHRLGLPTRNRYKPKGPRKNRPRVIGFRERRSCEHGGQRAQKRQFPKPVLAPIPDPLMIDLMSKSDSQCSFPIGHVGEPGFGFCGHPATHGPYCAGHHRLTHIPLKPVNTFGIAA